MCFSLLSLGNAHIMVNRIRNRLKYGRFFITEEESHMACYSTITRVTEYGPYVRKLILELGFDIGVNDVCPDSFHVHCVRKEEDGTVVMHKERFDPKALPSMGNLAVQKAYPCDAAGQKQLRGSFCALEIPEELPAKRTEGTVLSSRYVCNEFRITQLKTLVNNEGDPVSGLVFDTCSGDFCPDTVGWANSENAMRYGYFTPANPEKKKLPLLIWLHGAGEGGNDTKVAYTGNHVTLLSDAPAQKKLGGAAWILVPQCPTVWMDDGKEQLGHSNISIYTKNLKACIDGFIADHADTVDMNRIYISGISNGGFMTMRMIFDYPDFFAAAAPGCQAFFTDNVTDEMIQRIKDIPIWFTHAKEDELVNSRQTSLPIYHRLKNAGGENIHFTYWETVVDPTGLYKDEFGRPKPFFNHGVWILMLNDVICQEMDGSRVIFGGEPVTLLEWLGKQKKD